jgi:ActR/RegA family two-component response regulator
MEANRVLFVDDEYNLRLTFPKILELHGFKVRVAASVSEALSEITTQPFDILISDLNIGEPGDGFTVVSAMRRTQPDCINFILTGFPAFESALSAIQKQVDDYLVKPADIEQLVGSIHEKLARRRPHQPMTLMRLSDLLRANVDEICNAVLSKMKSDPSLGSLPMSDRDRLDHLPLMLVEIADQLGSKEPDQLSGVALRSGQKHGLQRLSVDYEISMLVTDTAILDGTVYDVVREHFLMLDTSNLVMDLKRFNQALQTQLKVAVQAYCEQMAELRHIDHPD